MTSVLVHKKTQVVGWIRVCVVCVWTQRVGKVIMSVSCFGFKDFMHNFDFVKVF